MNQFSALRFVAAGAGLGVAVHADEVAGDLVAGGRAAKFAGGGSLGGANCIERLDDALTQEGDLVVRDD